MAIDVRTNPPALQALGALRNISKLVNKNIERLSTGYRINNAADDPAGLQISEKLRTQIRGNIVAARNTQQGIAVTQVADSGLQTMYEKLQRMRELSIEASNSTVTDFSTYNNELNALRSQIDDLAASTKFNDTPLLTGATTSYSIQYGPNAGDSVDIGSAFADARATTASGLNLTDAVNFASNSDASDYIEDIDAAIDILNSRVAEVGKFQGLLNTRLDYIEVINENLKAADASIRDTDIAAETTALARNQIMQQVANAVLIQANNIPSLALSLLR